jgi:hypothetical protein
VEYQVQVAIKWVIELISADHRVAFVQVESNGIPGTPEDVWVDDIVVGYYDGHRLHVQAKKNQPRNGIWSLANLADELPKIRKQLEACDTTLVQFASGSPFGVLKSLCDAPEKYPDLSAFDRSAGKKTIGALNELSERWSLNREGAFRLLPRLRLLLRDYEGLRGDNLNRMRTLVTNPDLAMESLGSPTTSTASCLSWIEFVARPLRRAGAAGGARPLSAISRGSSHTTICSANWTACIARLLVSGSPRCSARTSVGWRAELNVRQA